jgi:hypothetical protein
VALLLQLRDEIALQIGFQKRRQTTIRMDMWTRTYMENLLINSSLRMRFNQQAGFSLGNFACQAQFCHRFLSWLPASPMSPLAGLSSDESVHRWQLRLKMSM